MNRWLNSTVELAAADCGVVEEQYADVAIYFLRGDLQEVMKVRRGVYLKHAYDSNKVPIGKRFWVWKDFKEDLRRVVGELLVFALDWLICGRKLLIAWVQLCSGSCEK